MALLSAILLLVGRRGALKKQSLIKAISVYLSIKQASSLVTCGPVIADMSTCLNVHMITCFNVPMSITYVRRWKWATEVEVVRTIA